MHVKPQLQGRWIQIKVSQGRVLPTVSNAAASYSILRTENWPWEKDGMMIQCHEQRGDLGSSQFCAAKVLKDNS